MVLDSRAPHFPRYRVAPLRIGWNRYSSSSSAFRRPLRLRQRHSSPSSVAVCSSDAARPHPIVPPPSPARPPRGSSLSPARPPHGSSSMLAKAPRNSSPPPAWPWRCSSSPPTSEALAAQLLPPPALPRFLSSAGSVVVPLLRRHSCGSSPLPMSPVRRQRCYLHHGFAIRMYGHPNANWYLPLQ